MKKAIISIMLFIASMPASHANELNQQLINLAVIYRNFVFVNNPSDYAVEQLNRINQKELEATKAFIKAAISPNNQLATPQFLTVPDEKTLHYIYTIRQISGNLKNDKPMNNTRLIRAIHTINPPRYELIDCYYSMLFTGIVNKNGPFGLTQIDFLLDHYQLQDDTEKGIFFLRAIEFCGKSIWGYIHVAQPPNYEKALHYINNFPRFNGQKYYQYLSFGFRDFEMQIASDQGPESYKHQYINEYYNVLLMHIHCLKQVSQETEQAEKIFLGSILKEENYYKYSQNQSMIKSLFLTVDAD